MRRYIDLTIGCADTEMADIVVAFLADYPFETFDTVESAAGVAVKAYILSEAWAECRKEALSAIADYGSVFSEVELEDKNWNERWERESFERVDIDNQIVIRSEYHQAPSDPAIIDIVVKPSMSFGSGHHHTTRMMCRLIYGLQPSGMVLDVGCGTGVLSFAALKCGAECATAVDIDPWSVESARVGAALNDLAERVEVVLGTVEAVEGRVCDMVVANINRNIILGDLDRYVAALRAGGTLLLSGFLTADAPIIEAAACERGLRLTQRLMEDDWVAESFVKE
ncbi:MAG: 50S ribosomal protein L11 methyltransferase [Alistipes sp.]|nr:50S ribosomal protein L11 methyltransferase [Alistipes sp.]